MYKLQRDITPHFARKGICQTGLEKLLVFALITIITQNFQLQLQCSRNCYSITILITITMQRFSKHCGQFSYI